ncbi:hypothetical protein BDEG_27783 [Batrachochytrium dendrobatidis JEL423]|uniref:Uncharacterized protein n=1 Tax=Batrachochytrium dendrobatidis (strain JEL423) TaxID=403673 RepID=A0A177WWV7_BATDL|nr:hypothetical protein BDEG_27783 [Batrachochytrium dendrobatidis JEL423]
MSVQSALMPIELISYFMPSGLYDNRTITSHLTFAIMFAGFGIRSLATLALCSTLLYRVRALFKEKQKSKFIALGVLSAATSLSTIAHSTSVIQTATAYTGSLFVLAYFTENKTVMCLGALSHILLAIYIFLCSALFISVIHAAIYIPGTSIYHTMLRKSDGSRLVGIILLSIYIGIAFLYRVITFRENSLTYAASYADAWLFPLSLYTFLSTNYVHAVNCRGESLTPTASEEFFSNGVKLVHLDAHSSSDSANSTTMEDRPDRFRGAPTPFSSAVQSASFENANDGILLLLPESTESDPAHQQEIETRDTLVSNDLDAIASCSS